MAKKCIIGVILLVIVGFNLIIIGPIPLLSIKLSSYGSIEKFLPYSYEPDSPSSIELLNLNIDVGNITINYIDPPVDYHVKIDVYIIMSGSHLAGKLYSDYFNIIWQNIGSLSNFTLKLISDDWFKPSIWFEKNISVVVSIRKDITFDIVATVNEGDVEVTVPYHVLIGNLKTILSKGNLFYNFEQCAIEGNITGITNEGDLELKSYNVEYTQNSNWMFISNETYVEIYQSIEMGANITGTAIISTGIIDLFYHDNTADIGAVFPFPISSWHIPSTQPGFEYTILDEGFFYISNDFPTKNNYNISFYHLGGPGPLNHIIKIRSD
ncbi:MAG: hypothetical protein ACFE8N_08695 [Promethearchaeota archaeon]